MHENEFDIDENLVRSLLSSQCPQWANLPIKAVPSSGTGNALFRLGDEYVMRLPRLDGAFANITKEYEWVPKIAELVNTPLSEPFFKGQPNHDYPSIWTIVKWNEGYNPDFEQEHEYASLAKELACFLNELHDIKLANGPLSRRGIALKELDAETSQAIRALQGEIDGPLITTLWNKLSNTPSWHKDPVWIHGDLLPGNILIQKNLLSAVIDFSDVGIGDPACDCIIAWSLLNANSRKIFKESLNNMDDHTWERGRGWALSIALIILPYYKHTNPVFVRLAKRMIEQVLQEELF